MVRVTFIFPEQTVTPDIGSIPNPGGDGFAQPKSFVPEDATISNRLAYVWSPNYIDAMVLRDKDEAAEGNYKERLYVEHDANFNVTSLTDRDGLIVERMIYDPYGQATFKTVSWGTASSSSYAWRHLFQGLRYDNNVGLYDMRMRAYSSLFGRQLQNDPAGYADGLNRYSMEAANPLFWLDPSGETIEVQTHLVSGTNNHTSIKITPDNQTKYAKDKRFRKGKDGRLYLTVGAGPGGFWKNTLVSDLNRPNDVDTAENPKGSRIKLNTPAKYKNEDEGPLTESSPSFLARLNLMSRDVSSSFSSPHVRARRLGRVSPTSARGIPRHVLTARRPDAPTDSPSA